MNRLFGSKQFYKQVFKITLPIIAQLVIGSIVNLVDNLMVGQLNEDVISGVYIASKVIFVINIVIFGAIAGASVFSAQFYGGKDNEHVKQCFNFKIYADVSCAIIGTIVFIFFGEAIAKFFVNDVQAHIAGNYLKIYAICLIPFAITNILGTCYREVHQTIIPMVASTVAVLLNVLLNYIFIFDHHGYFGWGYEGAVIATVIARFVEFGIIFISAIKQKQVFLNNVFAHPKIDKDLTKHIIVKSIPLLLNEALWSVGQIILVFAYTKVSEQASSALSISQTLFDLFNIASIALGNGVAVMIGSTLGANLKDEAKKQIGYFITLAIIIALVMSSILLVVGPLIAKLYKVSDEARLIANKLIFINVCLMGLMAINNTLFFAIRAGGFTIIVLLFDSVFVWVVQVPLALILSLKSTLTLPLIFMIVNLMDIIKLVIGSIIIKSGIWIKNLTIDTKKETA